MTKYSMPRAQVDKQPRWSAKSLGPLTFLLFLTFPVLLFWRSGFFFINDDWTILIQMAQQPLGRYLLLPDGEQWFPFFHLVYYGLIKIIGERYDLLVLVNCLGVGLNAFLMYCFFRRHFSEGLALAFGLLYAGAALNHAIIWNAFYLCYILSFGFLLGALLLTDTYRRSPSHGKLGGIGLCAFFSVLSHNYTLLGLISLPLYAGLQGEPGSWRKTRPLWIVIGLVYLAFSWGYVSFAGSAAATSHNAAVFSSLPGFSYFLHLFLGALLSPFFYLFWGCKLLPQFAVILSYILGPGLLICLIAMLWLGGESRDRRLALWALLFNVLPFFLVSLTRYQRSVGQALEPRYGIFTLFGALFLVGVAWGVFTRKCSWISRPKLLLGILLSAWFCGQIFSLPFCQEKYVQKSRAAASCYAALSGPEPPSEAIAPEVFKEFCPTAHPRLTRDQVVSVRRFLAGRAQKPEN
jgi:hypothetical protein